MAHFTPRRQCSNPGSSWGEADTARCALAPCSTSSLLKSIGGFFDVDAGRCHDPNSLFALRSQSTPFTDPRDPPDQSQDEAGEDQQEHCRACEQQEPGDKRLVREETPA